MNFLIYLAGGWPPNPHDPTHEEKAPERIQPPGIPPQNPSPDTIEIPGIEPEVE